VARAMPEDNSLFHQAGSLFGSSRGITGCRNLKSLKKH
jgi:hypothetical protein